MITSVTITIINISVTTIQHLFY